MKSENLFDVYDFVSIENKYTPNKPCPYFTKVPDGLIQCNLRKQYKLHRIFYIIYILIDRHRSRDNQSYIMISEVLSLCGYKISTHKKKIFYEIIKCILFLHDSQMIVLSPKIDIDHVGYNDCIQVDIVCANFDPIKNFTTITTSQWEFITSNQTLINTENILSVFLYINSYIYRRKKNDSKIMYPEAFWKSLETMAKDLSMSKNTINKCIAYLSSSLNGCPALLVKHDQQIIQYSNNSPPKQIPNIYVLNQDGYKKEIELATQKILQTKKG